MPSHATIVRCRLALSVGLPDCRLFCVELRPDATFYGKRKQLPSRWPAAAVGMPCSRGKISRYRQLECSLLTFIFTQAGYVVLELILPLLLVSILFSAIGKPTLQLLGSLLSLAFMVVYIAVTAAAEEAGNFIA